MRVHFLQHVRFEGPANVGKWAAGNGHTVTATHLYKGDAIPSLDSIDWLVIMGGPMNIHEEDRHAWLIEEKRFIRSAIDGGKLVLGICLGAQLIADVLGAEVARNEHKEIGWYEVTLAGDERGTCLLDGLPSRFNAFHWHGDTFGIPDGCAALASSEACRNQAFQYGAHVLALQFHLDYSRDSIRRMIDECGDELVEGAYIHRDESLLLDDDAIASAEAMLSVVLGNMQRAAG